MYVVDAVKTGLSGILARAKSGELQEAAAKKTPAMRQYEYAVARRSILGEFSSEPIKTSVECQANAKAARRKERLDLVSRALVACPRHAPQAARLRQDMDEVENMRCAKHVYLANDPDAPPDLRDNPPPGFVKPSPEQLEEMGLDEDLLNPVGSNFKAAVYFKDPAVWGEDSEPKAVLAFRGSTPEKEDWDNNFRQDANAKAPYYERAVLIGNSLAKHHASVQLVGHSLGGGLASAAQGGSGLTASTYNAAGLHSATVAQYSKDALHRAAEACKIRAIRLDGEVLTKTQETGLTGLIASKAVGEKRVIMPSHDNAYFQGLQGEEKVEKGDSYDTYLHGMDEVIDSTEKEKREDESILKNASKENVMADLLAIYSRLRRAFYFVLLTIGVTVMFSFTATAAPSFDLKAANYYFEESKSLALLDAAMAGKLATAKDLVAKGADPNAEGPLHNPHNRLRLLHYAIAAHNGQAVRVLVEVGADPELNTIGGGGPAFLFAVTLDNVDMLSLLIDLRPIKELSNEMLRHLLFESVIRSRPRCLDLLLQKGAPIDFRDKSGYTVMMRALDAQEYDLAEHLILQGASVAIEAKGGMTPAYSIEYDLQKFKPGSPTYNKVLHIKKMMEERGAVFPALSPAEVRAKRGKQ
jgi:hypothetical protein